MSNQIAAQDEPLTNDLHKLKGKFAYAMTQLRPKHRKFVRAYVKTGNATQAALDAGYAERSAPVRGHLLLRKDNGVRYALRIAEKMEAIEHGLPLSMKRKMLMDMIETASNPDNFNGAWIKGGIELLAKLDRDAMTADINIDMTQLPVMKIVTSAPPAAPTVIDVEPQEEDKPVQHLKRQFKPDLE